MKAAQITDYGGPDVMKTVTDAPKPVPKEGEVLVEVYAAGLNPFDWKVREGYLKESLPLKMPAILGGDLAGLVVELGPGVSGFLVGQEVYGMANAAGGHGSYAEFAPVKATQLAGKPLSINFAAAAALPLAGVSAYQALVGHMDLQVDQKILIHGGAGGIGSLAVQIAKSIGAYVAATAAGAEADFVKSLGADEVIDYQTQDFSKLLAGYDAVFDTIGGETNVKSYGVLKPGGSLVSMVQPPDEQLVVHSGVKYTLQSSRATQERLQKLTALVDGGKLRVQVDKIFPLTQAAEALEYLKSGHPRGKVVIKIKD